MGVTILTPEDRIASRRLAMARRFGPHDWLLTGASCVALVALVLAYNGRIGAFAVAERARQGAPLVNLNTVKDAASLEPAFAQLLAAPADRRFAAAELFRFLLARRAEGSELRNVGAISAALVDARALVRVPDLLEGRRDAAAVRAAAPGQRVRLIGDGQLAAVKPFMVVRASDEFRGQVLVWAVVYLLAFQAVALFWRWRAMRKDLVLLAAIHVLTAIGFAALLSRPDPLRDQTLFVWYSATVTFGLVLFVALSLLDLTRLGLASLVYLPLGAAFLLSLVLILFGDGPGGARPRSI